MRRPGEVVSKSTILEHVWDFAFDGRPQHRRGLRAPAAAAHRRTVRARLASRPCDWSATGSSTTGRGRRMTRLEPARPGDRARHRCCSPCCSRRLRRCWSRPREPADRCLGPAVPVAGRGPARPGRERRPAADLRNVDDNGVAQVVGADGQVLAASPNIAGRAAVARPGRRGRRRDEHVPSPRRRRDRDLPVLVRAGPEPGGDGHRLRRQQPRGGRGGVRGAAARAAGRRPAGRRCCSALVIWLLLGRAPGPARPDPRRGRPRSPRSSLDRGSPATASTTRSAGWPRR